MPIKSPYPDPQEPSEINVHHAVLRRPDQIDWPNFPVHIDAMTGKTRGFKDFVERVEWGATALGAPVERGGLGLSSENGDMIGIMSENNMDYITFAHACFYITTPIAFISSFSKPFELRHALKLSKANCLFVDEKFLSMALPIAKEVGISPKRIFVMTGHVSGRKSFSQLIDEARAKKLDIIDVRPAQKDTLAYLLFSSGTTGLPKAVMLSHGNLLYSIAQMALLAQFSPGHATLPASATPCNITKTLAFLPFYHSFGFNSFCVSAFVMPATIVIMSKWNIELALELIPKYKISFLPLVPSVVHQLVHHPKTAKTDLSSLARMNSGGAYLPPELGKKLSSFVNEDSSLLEGYGMSESAMGVILSPSHGSMGGRLKPKRGSLGVLVPGVEARILRDDGAEAAVNEVGELWVKTPTAALGYWDNEKATKETFVNGWLRTGDKFRLDEEGYFFFEDRAKVYFSAVRRQHESIIDYYKDTLKVSGSQVSPVEIENVLLAHPKNLIQDVTVAGVIGGRTSDEKVPRAWVVQSKEGRSLGAAGVIKELEVWHQQNLSKYKWLRGGIEVIKEIPKSPTGKVLRRELQDKYEQDLSQRTTSKL